MLNQLICADCVSGMKKLPDGCVQLTVTSPPWDQLRSFKGNQLSWEMFCVVAAELYRITCAGGVVCWHYGEQIKEFAESLTSRRQLMYFVDEAGFTCHKTLITETTGGNHGETRQYLSPQYLYVLSKGRPRTINLIRDVRNQTFGVFKRYSKYEKDDKKVRSGYKEIPEYLAVSHRHHQCFREVRSGRTSGPDARTVGTRPDLFLEQGGRPCV
jgi:hypothetical protein